MSIFIPPQNIIDKLLAIFGKVRFVVAPKKVDQMYQNYGSYLILKAKREGFWRALFRRRQDH